MSLRKAIQEVLEPQKIEEATDVFDKFGIQITRTALKAVLVFKLTMAKEVDIFKFLKKI